ncbi:UNKNOWN [Stylonychia lemnae]|uniref:Uncharacterized protein n=1 Tax=Stylonychia lemnae TaxID=5949 RepID=A0A078B1C1_STYLE|nr:UNKNOWN [Stylonychia lemnae]|eukprot:CDW88344.1 UNKNOWN [Stylonychia lemnae]
MNRSFNGSSGSKIKQPQRSPRHSPRQEQQNVSKTGDFKRILEDLQPEPSEERDAKMDFLDPLFFQKRQTSRISELQLPSVLVNGELVESFEKEKTEDADNIDISLPMQKTQSKKEDIYNINLKANLQNNKGTATSRNVNTNKKLQTQNVATDHDSKQAYAFKTTALFSKTGAGKGQKLSNSVLISDNETQGNIQASDSKKLPQKQMNPPSLNKKQLSSKIQESIIDDKSKTYKPAATPAAKSMRTFAEFKNPTSGAKNRISGFESDNNDEFKQSFQKDTNRKSIIGQQSDFEKSFDHSNRPSAAIANSKRSSILLNNIGAEDQTNQQNRRHSRTNSNNIEGVDPKIQLNSNDQHKNKNKALMKQRIMKQIDDNLASVGLESEQQSVTREQITENPQNKEITLRDFKILILSINKIFFDWMTLSAVNVDESQKVYKDFGFFYNGKFYIASKEEAKAINQTFLTLFENKKIFDMSQRKTKPQKSTQQIQQQLPDRRGSIKQNAIDARQQIKNNAAKTSNRIASALDTSTSIQQNSKKQIGQPVNKLSAVAAQNLRNKVGGGATNTGRTQVTDINKIIKSPSKQDLNSSKLGQQPQKRQIAKYQPEKGGNNTNDKVQKKDSLGNSKFVSNDDFFSDEEDIQQIQNELELKQKMEAQRKNLLLEQQRIKLQLQATNQQINKVNQIAQKATQKTKGQNSGYMTQQEQPEPKSQFSDKNSQFNDRQSQKSAKTLEFLSKQNDYDDVDLSQGVVYEVEEKSDESELSEYDSEAEEEEEDENLEAAPLIELEVNLDNGGIAKLQIFNEEKFEEDITEFANHHGLDDIKRKKLLKIVKLQLIDMFKDGQFGDLDDSNDMADDKDIDQLNQEIERANEKDKANKT